MGKTNTKLYAQILLVYLSTTSACLFLFRVEHVPAEKLYSCRHLQALKVEFALARASPQTPNFGRWCLYDGTLLGNSNKTRPVEFDSQ